MKVSHPDFQEFLIFVLFVSFVVSLILFNLRF